MPNYILDTCVDIDPTHANYPRYFFIDLQSNIRVKLVFGGSKFQTEARSKLKLRELLNNLKDRNQLIIVSDEHVDQAEEVLEARIRKLIGSVPMECDDLHIFALAKTSGCLLVVSRDARMATCRNKIRNVVGHEHCPDIKVIQNETAYKQTK